MKKQLMSAIAVAILVVTGCTRINPTEAGFKISQSGDYRGIDSLPLLTGWQFYLPWATDIVTIPTTQQHIVWTENATEGNGDNQEITVACMGGSGFKIDVGLNYRVNAFKASKIYLKYATDDLESISQTYLRNVVRGSMQDISGTITVDSLLNNVPGFEKDVLAKLNAKLVPEGFTIDLFNVISQPRPIDKDLASSINAKIKAKQDAERVKMELQSSIANADKDIAKARGDSSARVIGAAAEAESIRRVQISLTPEYVSYIKATRWNGILPSVISGGGGGLFMTLPDQK